MARASIRLRRTMALVLAFVAGGVDAIGYLTLFNLFTAHMTGNTVATAVHVAGASWHEALRRGFVVPLYVFGVIAGGLVSKSASRRGVRASFDLPLALEAALLLAYVLVAPRVALGDRDHTTFLYYCVAAIPVLAMGLQSATLRRIADHSVRTTFVTGMLTVLGEQLVTWWLRRREPGGEGASRRAIARARFVGAVWVAYAAGGVVCALVEGIAHFGAVALPLLGLIAAMLLDARAARLTPDEKDEKARNESPPRDAGLVHRIERP